MCAQLGGSVGEGAWHGPPLALRKLKKQDVFWFQENYFKVICFIAKTISYLVVRKMFIFWLTPYHKLPHNSHSWAFSISPSTHCVNWRCHWEVELARIIYQACVVSVSTGQELRPRSSHRPCCIELPQDQCWMVTPKFLVSFEPKFIILI